MRSADRERRRVDAYRSSIVDGFADSELGVLVEANVASFAGALGMYTVDQSEELGELLAVATP